jgi:hypothetical protein
MHVCFCFFFRRWFYETLKVQDALNFELQEGVKLAGVVVSV